jgi:hypothetical protein
MEATLLHDQVTKVSIGIDILFRLFIIIISSEGAVVSQNANISIVNVKDNDERPKSCIC